MTFFDGYKIAASVVISLMVTLWLCSLMLKDASIVDRFWGLGFVLIAAVIAMVQPSLDGHQMILLTIVSIWGLRLSIYIQIRNQGHPEDPRYQEMRRHHGDRFWWYSFFSVFCLQGIIMLIVAMPVIFVMSDSRSFETVSLFVFLGFLVWLTGFIFEAGGDLQLARFKKNPGNKGKLLTTGLWSFTRHPNYFGDACQWWGFGMFAWGTGLTGYLTFIGPIVMTLFIRKVSGVDLLEKSLKTAKPGYAEYIASTPPFFPKLFK